VNSAALGERSSVRQFTVSDHAQRSLRVARKEYELHQSEATANEYLQTASILGLSQDPLAIDIAEKFRRVPSAMARARTIQATDVVTNPTVTPQVLSVADHHAWASGKVHRLRAIVRETSDRPLVWSELSRQYLILGEDDKARRAMKAALQLAPDNVYLTRCAVRMYTHLDEHAVAMKLLHRHNRSEGNPWLLAADVAISSTIGKTSRNLRHAQDILARDRTNSHNLSELAASVGTVELERGSRKRGRELFTKSLIAPTENSLAQAQWCVSNGESLGIPESAWDVHSSHEATALASRSAVDFATMIASCRAWFAEEPFSSRPAALASTACFDPELRASAKAFATLGLEYAPANSDLLNNRAVCHAYDGSTELAFADLSAAINTPGFQHYGIALATLGLICYRSSEPKLGRECYEKSIHFFKNSGETESALRASVHMAIEESRFDLAEGSRVLNDVRDRCRRVDRSRFPELSAVLTVADRTIPTSTLANVSNLINQNVPAKNQLAHFEAQLIRQIPEGLSSAWLSLD
jgi:Tfp pilus assembly protein PilF